MSISIAPRNTSVSLSIIILWYRWLIFSLVVIPITFVTDKGSETGSIFAHQTGLRYTQSFTSDSWAPCNLNIIFVWALSEAYTPDLDTESFPPMLQLRSVHNTPIEGLWHWFSQTFGINIKETIHSGYHNDGIYNPNNVIHPCVVLLFHFPIPLHIFIYSFDSKLFYWLWPQILQAQLDKFVEYWNNHRIRTQKEKQNMSGFIPMHGFTVPEPPAEDCSIEVDQPVIDALRTQIPVSREESMRWVSPAFEKAARRAYRTIGRPPLDNISSGWGIFSSIAAVIDVAAATSDDS